MDKVIEQYADGSIVERDLTADELKQIQIDKQAFEAAELLREENKKKKDLLLARLGIDETELDLLLSS